MPPGDYFLFCRPLREGVLFAGHFTSIISMIACALAFAVFFRESGDDDGHSKLLSFSVVCYATFYIFMSRSLIRGVKDERRDKFVCWIIMSILTVAFLLSGILFIVVRFFTGEFQENTLITFTVLTATVLSIFVTGLLVYCIWGVVTLCRLYGGGNVEGAVV